MTSFGVNLMNDLYSFDNYKGCKIFIEPSDRDVTDKITYYGSVWWNGTCVFNYESSAPEYLRNKLMQWVDEHDDE